MVVENTGHGPGGAFDVASATRSRRVPGPCDRGLNLCVTDGTGAPFTSTATGMFTAAARDRRARSPARSPSTIPGPPTTPDGALDPPVAD